MCIDQWCCITQIRVVISFSRGFVAHYKISAAVSEMKYAELAVKLGWGGSDNNRNTCGEPHVLGRGTKTIFSDSQ